MEQFSEYGSLFSMYSNFNSFASDQPDIVDKDGNFYGRLSVNEFHPQLGIGLRFQQWLKRLRVLEEEADETHNAGILFFLVLGRCVVYNNVGSPHWRLRTGEAARRSTPARFEIQM